MNVNTHRFYGYLDDEKLFFPSAQLPRRKNYFIYVIIIAQMFTFCYIYLQFIFENLFPPSFDFLHLNQGCNWTFLFCTSLYVMSFIHYLAGSPGNHTRYFQYGRTSFKACYGFACFLSGGRINRDCLAICSCRISIKSATYGAR